MSKLIFIICFIFNLFFTNCSWSQETFEGKLVYKNNYNSKISSVPSEQLNKMMGDKQFYAINKKGNYKSVFNGLFIRLQIYRSDENRNYTLTVKSDTLYYENYELNTDKALSFVIQKNADIIMGIPCDMIEVKSEKSKTYIYYNNKYYVDPRLFEKHNYGNFNYILDKIKSLPLKIVQETDRYLMTSIVTEITPMKFNDNVFEVQNKKRIAPARPRMSE